MTQTYSKFTAQRSSNSTTARIQTVTYYKANLLTHGLIAKSIKCCSSFKIEQLDCFASVVDDIATLAEYFSIDVKIVDDAYVVKCYHIEDISI